MQDYPIEAVRELVVNALVHRDYEQEGSIEIEHTPDWLSISSPGGLVFGVTPDNILTRPSTPRYRLLLETVTILQVAERTGQGIDRAYRELLRAGKQPPTVADDGFLVRVLVQGGMGNDAFARYVAAADPSVTGDIDALLAIAHLRDRRTLTAADPCRAAQRSPAEVQAVLDRLSAARLVEPSRRTARSAFLTYALTAAAISALGRAVTYHSRTTDDIDRKVIDHVREYGYITNQTLRRLFNLDLYRARNLLQDLQLRGIPIKVDPGRGGPGVRYGPGAALAAPRTQRRSTASRRVSEVEALPSEIWPEDRDGPDHEPPR
jgi:ATP-dependent DNA helicase RecG